MNSKEIEAKVREDMFRSLDEDLVEISILEDNKISIPKKLLVISEALGKVLKMENTNNILALIIQGMLFDRWKSYQAELEPSNIKKETENNVKNFFGGQDGIEGLFSQDTKEKINPFLVKIQNLDSEMSKLSNLTNMLKQVEEITERFNEGQNEEKDTNTTIKNKK